MIFASRSQKMFIPEEGAPGAPIPSIYARKLVRQYRAKHHSHLLQQGEIGFNTVYVAMAMQELIVCLQAMYKNGEGSDICRIYFGAHDGEEQNDDGQNISNKMTLIFVGAKKQGECVVEQLDNATMMAYDFGTLCPPQCKICCENDNSLARQIFEEEIEELCPPNA